MINKISTELLGSFIISPDASISDAIAKLDAAGTGALAVCTEGRKLWGMLTDGDVRRGMLGSKAFSDSCRAIANRRPILVTPETSRLQALYLMNRHDINHLPMIDDRGVLQDLLLRRDLVLEEELEENASERLETVALEPSASITEAIAQLDRAGTGALVLCGADRVLRGMLTDGDIRRAILRHVSMETSCGGIASREPLTAASSISASEALHLMNEHDINHLPVVDASGCVTRLLLRRDLGGGMGLNLSAVIMAGGFGKRLLPLTERVPKPMLLVGDKPLLELTIQQLRRSGISDISLTTHYLPENIVNHFGDGSSFGVRLNYIRENHPLGTAGGLKLLQRTDKPFLVINGDILTGLPFHEMLNFHRSHGALLTVGIRKYDVQVPFGVVECDDIRITRLEEKPSLNFFVNAGVYLLEPSVCEYLADDQHCDMTDLIQKLIEAGKPVVSFPIMEYWMDVGRHDDYALAQEAVRNGKII